MTHQITDVFKYFFSSLKFVARKKLYIYFLPSIILAIIFYISMKGGQSMAQKLSFMDDWWLIGSLINSLESGIKTLSFFLFEIIILVFLVPINSYFAEKVKEDITGIKTDFDFGSLMRSLVRSIGIFIVAFGVEMILLLVIWLFSFLVGDLFNDIVGFVVTSFFIGFSFFDFGLELNGKNVSKSWRFARKNKIICLISGLIFTVSIYIPEGFGFSILFIVSISLVPHMLTIGATQLYYTKYAQDPLEN